MKNKKLSLSCPGRDDLKAEISSIKPEGKKLQSKKGFTLVELIVVITILAVLSTIGFVSYSGYLAGTRDTSRIASLKAISDGLELYRTKHSLPMPEDYVEVKVDGDVIAYQGYVGKNVLETIEYSTEGVDPKDGTYYSYYLTSSKKYYQLMAFLEEQSETITSIKNNEKTYAIDYTTRYPSVFGKKLGILTNTENTPIQEILEITNSGYLELSDSEDLYIMHINYNKTLTASGKLLKAALIYMADSKYFAPTDCPEGFIGVPGNPDFDQKGFCVAQYEMSYDEITERDSNLGGEDWNTRKYNSSKTPVSMKNRLPIVDISQEEAITECKKIGTHLITNNEWMTIARNIELQKENYITGGPGNGVLKNGVSNNTTMGCAGVQDGTLWAGPTGSDCDGTNRNKLVLSNEKSIYDFSGNVWEHVNKANTIDGAGYNDGQTSISGSYDGEDGDGWDDDGIYDTGDMDKYGSLFHLGKSNGMGSIRYASGRTDNVILRGSNAYYDSNTGIFVSYLDWLFNSKDSAVGFRCAK